MAQYHSNAYTSSHPILCQLNPWRHRFRLRSGGTSYVYFVFRVDGRGMFQKTITCANCVHSYNGPSGSLAENRLSEMMNTTTLVHRERSRNTQIGIMSPRLTTAEYTRWDWEMLVLSGRNQNVLNIGYGPTRDLHLTPYTIPCSVRF
jgi:hypothetical protein